MPLLSPRAHYLDSSVPSMSSSLSGMQQPPQLHYTLTTSTPGMLASSVQTRGSGMSSPGIYSMSNSLPPLSGRPKSEDLQNTMRISKQRNSEKVAEKIIETLEESSFFDNVFTEQSEAQVDMLSPVSYYGKENSGGGEEENSKSDQILVEEKEFTDLASYFCELKSKAKELGIWETPLTKITEKPLNDKTNFLSSRELDFRLSATPTLQSSLCRQWIVVRRLLTRRGGVKLKAPDTIPDLLAIAGKALKIEACKVRDIDDQAEIITLEGPNSPIVFITTQEEENLYFS